MTARTLTAALAAAAAASISGVAQAQTYVEATVGLTNYPDLEWNGTDYEVDQGNAWGVAIGHHFTPTFSAELEFTHTKGEYTCCNPNNVSSDAFMANGYYRFLPGSTFRPYVGGGVGLVSVGYENSAVEREDQVLGWQVIGGGEFAVNPNVSLFGEYRFQSATGAEDTATQWDYQSHVFSVGARYSF